MEKWAKRPTALEVVPNRPALIRSNGLVIKPVVGHLKEASTVVVQFAAPMMP